LERTDSSYPTVHSLHGHHCTTLRLAPVSAIIAETASVVLSLTWGALGRKSNLSEVVNHRKVTFCCLTQCEVRFPQTSAVYSHGQASLSPVSV
jgi:hypothetical protein